MKAFVLLKSQVGAGNTIVQTLRRLPGVREAEVTFGPYDVIAIVETESLEGLGTLVTTGVQTIPGVIDTLTCLVVS